MNTGDRLTISGVFHSFTDGHLLIVPTNEMPFTKTPKKILDRESGEAGIYSEGPLYHTTTEVRLELGDKVVGSTSASFSNAPLVTIVGRLADIVSRGIPQLGIIVEVIATHSEISDEAFFKYIIGQPGTAEDHWRAAEKELLSRRLAVTSDA
jgi:hypothetical protein